MHLPFPTSFGKIFTVHTEGFLNLWRGRPAMTDNGTESRLTCKWCTLLLHESFFLLPSLFPFFLPPSFRLCEITTLQKYTYCPFPLNQYGWLWVQIQCGKLGQRAGWREQVPSLNQSVGQIIKIFSRGSCRSPKELPCLCHTHLQAFPTASLSLSLSLSLSPGLLTAQVIGGVRTATLTPAPCAKPSTHGLQSWELIKKPSAEAGARGLIASVSRNN
jgi:hypothetical protein